jgi:hypothetical protein
MTRTTWVRALLTGAAGAAIILTSLNCSDAPPPTSIKPGPATRNAAVGKAARERAAAARARTEWMARVHSEFVHDLTKNKATWLGPGRATWETKCNALWKLARKYGARVAQHAPLTPRLVSDVEAYAAARGCSGPSGLQALVTAPSQNAAQQFSIFGHALLQSEPTGAYHEYVPALEGVYNYAVYPSDVASASWAIVDQAAANGIPQADLDVVAGYASISVSSSYDWYVYEESGGFNTNYVDDPTTVQPMSLFQGGRYWRRLGYCDLGGALVGGWGGGFAGAVVLGFVASGICGLALMA